jgi:triosephosphate isomerase
MRNQIVAGNWKMNCTTAETEQLLNDLEKQSLNHRRYVN